MLPDGVTTIDDYAFYSCSSLSSITVPESVTSIGTRAFDRCGATIKGFTGSYAMAYAAENKIPFESVGEISAQGKGDVNADGAFNTADVVLLQKWLLAVPDTELADWQAADLYQDGRLNVFDLCLMKRELLSRSK